MAAETSIQDVLTAVNFFKRDMSEEKFGLKTGLEEVKTDVADIKERVGPWRMISAM